MKRIAWVAVGAAALAVASGLASIALASAYDERSRGPLLYALASTFVLTAIVVVIRAWMRHRLRAKGIRSSAHPGVSALITLVVALLAWALLFFGAFTSMDIGSVLYDVDGVPWARVAVLWLIATCGIAAPAARSCLRDVDVMKEHEPAPPTLF